MPIQNIIETGTSVHSELSYSSEGIEDLLSSITKMYNRAYVSLK